MSSSLTLPAAVAALWQNFPLSKYCNSNSQMILKWIMSKCAKIGKMKIHQPLENAYLHKRADFVQVCHYQVSCFHFCCSSEYWSAKTNLATFSMCKYEQMFEGYWKFWALLSAVVTTCFPSTATIQIFVSSSSGILIIPTTTSMDSFIVATSFAASLEKLPRR